MERSEDGARWQIALLSVCLPVLSFVLFRDGFAVAVSESGPAMALGVFAVLWGTHCAVVGIVMALVLLPALPTLPHGPVQRTH